MDDERDEGLGSILRGAAGVSRTAGAPDFGAVYATLSRKRSKRRAFAIAPALAAALAFAIILPTAFGNGGTGTSLAYRSQIRELSALSVRDENWGDSLFAMEEESEQSGLGEFIGDLWNL